MKLGLELKAPETLGLVLPSLKLDFDTGDIKLQPKKELSPTSVDQKGEATLLVRARIDGLRGLPPSDDEEAERTQRGIALIYKAAVARVDAITLANREAFIGDFKRLQELSVDRVRIVRLYKQKVDEFLATNRSRAIQIVRSFNVAEQRLSDFKRKNKLEREAVLASDDMAGWIIVAGVALFEFVLSLILFAIAFPGGMAEAFAFLLPVTFFNVINGLVSGFYGTRNLHRQGAWLKGLGAAIIVVGFLLAFYVNLEVAHLRDIVSDSLHTNILGALRDAVDPNRAASIPTKVPDLLFGLGNLESLTFLVLGMITWGFSVWKGVSGFDDVVPGFRQLTKERNDRRRDREQFFTLMRQWLQQENAEILRGMESFQHSIRRAKDQMEAQFREQKQGLAQVRKACEIMRDNAESLIKTYREVNRHVRRLKRFWFWRALDPKPPGYFKTPIELAPLPAENYEDLEPQLDAAHRRAEATITNLDEAIGTLSDEIAKSTDKLTAFEADVEAEAARASLKAAAE